MPMCYMCIEIVHKSSESVAIYGYESKWNGETGKGIASVVEAEDQLKIFE